MKMKLMGRAGVDSGKVMVADPSYVDVKKGGCQAALVVTTETQVGDGLFPVYLVEHEGEFGLFVEFNDFGTLAKILQKL